MLSSQQVIYFCNIFFKLNQTFILTSGSEDYVSDRIWKDNRFFQRNGKMLIK